MLIKMLDKSACVMLAVAGLLAPGLATRSASAQSPVAPAASPASSGRVIANRPTSAEQAAEFQTLYVDSEVGSDSADGIEAQPLRTVTRALEVAPPNTVIVLAPGRYSQGTGEVFPLQLKPGVTIQGTPGSSERTAIIEGGGNFDSPSRSQQNAAIIAADRAGIAQIAVSNPDGYGVWIESASPTILESAFVGNRQTGIYVAGGSPRVHGSYFSGNQVAGLIVFGTSRANIQRNIFDGTGDAIRVLDGAMPEIVGNRITNNDAGLVLIGDAQPVMRDNQIVGNLRNEVVEVAAGVRDVSAAPLVEIAVENGSDKLPMSTAAREPVVSTPPPVREADRGPIVSAPPARDINREPAALRPISLPSSSRPVTAETPENSAVEIAVVAADESVEATDEALPAGSSGAALQALQGGLALGPRAVTGENPDSGSLIRNRRPRSRPSERRPRPSARPTAPANNNRLAVPNTSIPIGSGGSSSIFAPPSGGAGSPPAPPSQAQALGLYYRVFVETGDPFEQDSIREVVPDAFRSRFEGRSVMQVGAFPTEDEAEDRRRLLEDNGFDVRVEYIR
ncbi:MAG: DUF1565 domain-containing protein [Cyanobacteria bacterium J06560_2]